MRLRRTLGPEAGSRLVTRHPGYLLVADTEEVDLLCFTQLCRAGHEAARAAQWERASAVLEKGLALWRGEPLADVVSSALHRDEAPRLEQARAQALEWRAEVDLHLGRHEEIVADLRQLTARYPLRERFHAQLMQALCQSGLRAESLEAYRIARERLVTELGVEPGPELQQLQRRILRGDRSVVGAGKADGAASVRPVRAESAAGSLSATQIPRQLPPAVRPFAGRRAELATLSAMLEEAAPNTAAVTVIAGMGGVGKTALAVHWARQAAGRYRDGQLYFNLRGYDPGTPTTAADALAACLRALGVPPSDIPADEAGRSALFRSMVASRRMLIVLDNANTAEQVRPILPGAPGCAVVVTSRDSLASLVARDGALRLDLDPLLQEEATSLLAELIGSRADAEPETISVLATWCARLPLALRVAAELTCSRPAAPISDLAHELRDQRERLDALVLDDDPSTSIRAVFSWSWRSIDTRARQMFVRLSLHPGPDFEPYSVAALTGLPVTQTRSLLHVLSRAHLLQAGTAGRYALHDLLRDYARELAAQHLDAGDRMAAMTRLLDHYAYTCAQAMDVYLPAARHRRPRIPRPDSPTPPLSGAAAALTWLDQERAALVAAADFAAHHGYPEHVSLLAATAEEYLSGASYYPEAITLHMLAYRVARQEGNQSWEAAALASLGVIDAHQSLFDTATRRFELALALHDKTKDQGGAARVLVNLGIVRWRQGNISGALACCTEAAERAAQAGDAFGEANALNNTGAIKKELGQRDEAVEIYQRVAAFYRDNGDRNGEAVALCNLADIDVEAGRYVVAAGHYRRCLVLAREAGARSTEVVVLGNLGAVSSLLGEHELAVTTVHQALTLTEETGFRFLEASLLNKLGEVLFRYNRTDQARSQYTSALRLASESGEQSQQAVAQAGLAKVSLSVGDYPAARRYWQAALGSFTALSMSEAEEARVQLAALAQM